MHVRCGTWGRGLRHLEDGRDEGKDFVYSYEVSGKNHNGCHCSRVECSIVPISAR